MSDNSSVDTRTISDDMVGDHNERITRFFAIYPGVEGDFGFITRTSPPIGTPYLENIIFTQAWPMEDNVVYEAQKITFIPVSVKHIMFSTQRRELLPQHEEVLKVVKCILRQDTESADIRSANIGKNTTDDVNTPTGDSSTIQGIGAGESYF